ncbi:OPT oligopeptide transporter [Russula vinacea]|nr:OPT oligopeptide transporter [Russula vinacea]
MPPLILSPSLPTTPTPSWTQDSTLDDVQQELQSGPGDVIAFEKKWIVNEDGDDLFQDGLDKNVIFDPNLDSSSETTGEWEDESPYPEVRSAVSNTDDMEMPADTLRSWTIGLFWAIFIPGLNQFFHFRYPSITIGSLVAQLLSFPLGCAWARTVPGVRILGVSLNPGPFSLKEHVVITVMATVGSSSAYATTIIAVQRQHYNQDWSFAYQWLLVMSTQLVGFSLGGIAKRFLVSPPSMIWPANLVTCALFNTLHSQVYSGFRDSGMSRERFFLYGFLASFIWYFFPGYLFTALSTFSWAVNQLFGYSSGLGMSIITFDWNNIAFIGSPALVLRNLRSSLLGWAEANVTIGFCHCVYYHPSPTTQLFRMMSSHMFDNTGGQYNVTRILTPQSTLDEAAYKEYSPLFLSASFAMAYGLSFATITRHCEQPDVHARLMARYPQVVVFSISAVTIEVWPTEVPIWGLLTALCISAFYIVPAGMIQAITNQQIGLNVITELVAGYAFPGKPLAMMIFKTFGYITMYQALQFTSDMKLGHYMKVPPRTMFLTTQLGVQQWMFANITNFCSPQQADHFICSYTEVFFVASVVWGVIGPKRQFSPGQIYHGLTYFFLMGAVAPLAGWLINKRGRRVFSNMSILSFSVPVVNCCELYPWALIGFIFNFVIRRRISIDVLSAALDCGTAMGTLFIFFALQYPRRGTIGKGTIERWWGNTVYQQTADQNALPLRQVGAGEFFGPRSW